MRPALFLLIMRTIFHLLRKWGGGGGEEEKKIMGKELKRFSQGEVSLFFVVFSPVGEVRMGGGGREKKKWRPLLSSLILKLILKLIILLLWKEGRGGSRL